MRLRLFLKSGRKIILKDNKTLVEIVFAKVFFNSIKNHPGGMAFYGT